MRRHRRSVPNDILEPNETNPARAITKTSLLPSARELLTEQRAGLPIWVRAPVRGPEHFSSLTRAKLYDLSGKGLIRSRSLREPGAIRGCRLFHLKSILDYIERAGVENGGAE
jgi:hypothetical protein